MSLNESDMFFRLSSPSSASGFSEAQPDVNASLGGFMSTTPWVGGVINDLFDDITHSEDVALAVDYRCVFIHNTNEMFSAYNLPMWIESEVAGGASIAIGVDAIEASLEDSNSFQAAIASDENTAPSGVAFSSPTTQLSSLSVGNIGPKKCKAIWFRRTAANNGPVTNDGFTLRIKVEVAI